MCASKMATFVIHFEIMKIAIIGLGWFGAPLALSLRAEHGVIGSKTTSEGVENMRLQGIEAYRLELNPSWYAEPQATEALTHVDTLVLNIPPGMRSGGSASEYALKMESVLQHIQAGQVGQVVFISSTGVFGEDQNEVDEDTAPVPSRGAGEALYAAEQYFAERFEGSVKIIRPGGLVGGSRHPAKFLAGRKGISGQYHPVNLVHRDDLIAMTKAVIFSQTERRIFHAVAEKKPSKSEFYIRAAANMGLEPPSFDPSDASLGKAIYAAKSKAALNLGFGFEDPFDMAG